MCFYDRPKLYKIINISTVCDKNRFLQAIEPCSCIYVCIIKSYLRLYNTKIREYFTISVYLKYVQKIKYTFIINQENINP